MQHYFARHGQKVKQIEQLTGEGPGFAGQLLQAHDCNYQHLAPEQYRVKVTDLQGQQSCWARGTWPARKLDKHYLSHLNFGSVQKWI